MRVEANHSNKQTQIELVTEKGRRRNIGNQHQSKPSQMNHRNTRLLKVAKKVERNDTSAVRGGKVTNKVINYRLGTEKAE